MCKRTKTLFFFDIWAIKCDYFSRAACVCLMVLFMYAFTVCLDSYSFLFSVCGECWLVIFCSCFFLWFYSLRFAQIQYRSWKKKKSLHQNEIKLREKTKWVFSLCVITKHMFDQCLSWKEHDSQVVQVCQERYVHNHLYDIPN